MGNMDGSIIFLWIVTAILGALFFGLYHHEPRRFGNMYLFFLFFVAFVGTLGLTIAGGLGLVILMLIVLIGPFAAFVFLIVNTFVVTRREGVRLSTLLPALLDVLALACLIAPILAHRLHAPAIVDALIGLMGLEAFWFFFSLIMMIAYSVFSNHVPHRHHFDFIIIHGAGLMGTQLTPLLKGRADRAIDVWTQQGKTGRFVCSGGQGADEAISEAEALRRYLVSQGVPEEQILLEDRSTTTLENLKFSKKIMDEAAGGQPYLCALVTSDYHVLRALDYSRKAGIAKAEGIGSRTSGYYWPTATIREFIALTREHPWPYVIVFVLWALLMIASFGDRIVPR